MLDCSNLTIAAVFRCFSTCLDQAWFYLMHCLYWQSLYSIKLLGQVLLFAGHKKCLKLLAFSTCNSRRKNNLQNLSNVCHFLYLLFLLLFYAFIWTKSFFGRFCVYLSWIHIFHKKYKIWLFLCKLLQLGSDVLTWMFLRI